MIMLEETILEAYVRLDRKINDLEHNLMVAERLTKKGIVLPEAEVKEVRAKLAAALAKRDEFDAVLKHKHTLEKIPAPPSTMIVQPHKLIELGFREFTYKDQEGKPKFYKIENGLVVAEISSDYKFGQWCESDLGGYGHKCYNLTKPSELQEFVQYVLDVFRIDIGN